MKILLCFKKEKKRFITSFTFADINLTILGALFLFKILDKLFVHSNKYYVECEKQIVGKVGINIVLRTTYQITPKEESGIRTANEHNVAQIYIHLKIRVANI
jgi:hypothetical protein